VQAGWPGHPPATAGSKDVDKARSLLADKAQVDNAVREYLSEV